MEKLEGDKLKKEDKPKVPSPKLNLAKSCY